MSGNDLKVVDGTEAGAWIEPGLGGEFGAVSRQVPKVFDAYARIFHPATDSDRNSVSWATVAERLGRTAHREMQWHQLVGTSDTFGIEGSNWSGSIPSLGEMEVEDLDRLCRVLADHTADPESCFFGFCEINHHDLFGDAFSFEELRLPRLKLPLGRDHLVLSGPLFAVDQLRSPGRSNVTTAVLVKPGEKSSSKSSLPDPADRSWREVPSLIWPTDRSWYVASEVDFDSTLVGGSRELVEALVAAPDLEVYEVESDTSLAAFSDKINLAAKPTE
jgi:hypothetical protein